MYRYYQLCVLLLAPGIRSIRDNDWQPIVHGNFFHDANIANLVPSQHNSFNTIVGQDYQSSALQSGDRCEVHKVGFNQDLYFQYVQYKTEIPDLKEFTLCFWTKYTNHTNDHPLFSYAVDGQPRAIYSWISNTDRSSYFSLSVEGHTFYRLNYPLRLNRWYHTCQSWNGKTGEWQIWVNAERVGRGFHNRLVNHKIPAGGIAISGQEQTQLGGGFQEGHDAPKGSGGMLGEITMVQLYSVALTAGKAHRDHKHHHAHQFDHNGTPITTPAPTTPMPRSILPTHPLLTSGQLNPSVKLNFAGGQPQPQPQLVSGQDYNAQYLNGQFVGNILTQQYLQSGRVQQPQQDYVDDQNQQQQLLSSLIPRSQQIPSNAESYSSQSLSMGDIRLVGTGIVHSSSGDSPNVQFIQNSDLDTHQLFKRDGDSKVHVGDIIKRDTRVKRSKQKKRELLVAGGTILDAYNSNEDYDESLLDGLASIGQNQPVLEQQKHDDAREPAEAEVKAVLNICSGCDEEPFGKALVFDWRSVPKKLYSGAFYTPAVPECRVF